MVAPELGNQPLACRRKSHQRRPPVGRVRLARHEPGFDERVQEPRHRPRRHVQRIGEDTLCHRPTLPELPEQMGAGQREIERLDPARHVVVQQHDELEDTIEYGFELLYLVYSEA